MCKEKQGVVEKDHDEDGAVVVMQMIKDGHSLHCTALTLLRYSGKQNPCAKAFCSRVCCHNSVMSVLTPASRHHLPHPLAAQGGEKCL